MLHPLRLLGLTVLFIATAAAAETTTDGRKTLYSVRTADNAETVFDVSVAPCRPGRACPLEVRLLQGDQVLGSEKLGNVVVDGAVRGTPSPALGVRGNRRLRAWTLGAEANAVEIAAQRIALSDQLHGLLVYRVQGFEHTHRIYDLFVALDNKLVRAWTGNEGMGPTSSEIEVFPSTNTILFTRQASIADDDRTDTWSLQALRWTDEAKGLVEVRRPPVYVVVAATFSDPTTALERRDRSDCYGDYLILGTDDLPGLPPGRIVLALPMRSSEEARQRLTRLDACSDQRGTVKVSRVRASQVSAAATPTPEPRAVLTPPPDPYDPGDDE